MKRKKNGNTFFQQANMSGNYKPPLVKTLRPGNILLLLLALLSVGAIFGGTVLIISPSGSMFGMPLSMLKNSPFDNFLLPGIILFTMLGVVPTLLSVILAKKPANKFAGRFNFYKDMYWGWTYSTYVAFVLIIWIQVEMTFCGQFIGYTQYTCS